jgi:hypothetical protein
MQGGIFMLASAFAALVLFAAPETVQPSMPEKSSEAAKEAPKKMCYTATPSGSRMPRKVCVTQSAPKADKDEHSADKAPVAKPE